MRYAGMDERGSSARARVRDLSATGISIVVASDLAPKIGEMLKIEFGLPGGRQVAWFATVVRVEHKNEWDPDLGDREFTLVGLRFRQLPAPFRAAIRRSLNDRSKGAEKTNLIDASADTARERTMFFLMTGVTGATLVLMSLPPEVWLAPFRALFR